MRWMKVILWKLALLPVCMVAQNLSEASTISLLTVSPMPERLVSFFGHTALRVNDPELNIDYVFNYGMFDESHSVYTTLASVFEGDLRCEMWVVSFTDFLDATRKENRRLVEHSLHLDEEEKTAVWRSLINNAKEENRSYVFDFFFRNCTTFPRDLLTNNLGKKIVLPSYLGERTYRQINARYIEPFPWILFFVDMMYGQNLDVRVAPLESLYIPMELEEAWLASHIEDGRSLIASSDILVEGSAQRNDGNTLFFTPLLCALILVAFAFSFFVFEWRKKVYCKWADVVLFGFAGLVGVLFFLFKIECAHCDILRDWLIVWLHPLHLAAAVVIMTKPYSRFLSVYHIVNLFLLGFLAAGIFFLPRHYNQAFIPFMACLWIRSGAFVVLNSHFRPRKVEKRIKQLNERQRS